MTRDLARFKCAHARPLIVQPLLASHLAASVLVARNQSTAPPPVRAKRSSRNQMPEMTAFMNHRARHRRARAMIPLLLRAGEQLMQQRRSRGRWGVNAAVAV